MFPELLRGKKRKDQEEAEPGRSPSRPAHAGPGPTPGAVPAQKADPLADWLKGIPSLSLPKDRANWLTKDPVLLIGLGRAGREVIREVWSRLSALLCGEGWPKHVRLMIIEVLQEGSESPPERQPGLFTLALNINQESLKTFDSNRLKWFDSSRRTRPPGRALGRLAVYLDLQQGVGKSRLWRALSTHVRDLEGLSVYIVADTFSDDASGLVADIAYLVQKVAEPSPLQRVDLFLACQHMRWGNDGLREHQRGQRTFAMLRELQRLQTPRPACFDYVPSLKEQQPQLDGEHRDSPLVGEIYLFDGKGEEGCDYSERKPEEAVFPIMAGCLLSLLYSPVRKKFYEQAVNRQALPARLKTGGRGLDYRVSAMGGHTVSLPVGELHRLLTLRLVHESLFNQDHGLFRWELLPSPGEKPPVAPWVATSGPAEQQEFASLIQPRGLSAVRLSPDPKVFSECLREYVAAKMNQQKQGALQWARAFLEAAEGQWPDYEEVIRSAQSSVEAWLNMVGTLPPAGVSPGTSPFSRWMWEPSEPESRPEGKLLQAWREQWQSAWDSFNRLSQKFSHHLLLTPEEAKDLSAPDQYWMEIQQRARWLWGKEGEDFKLRLLILPAELDDVSDPENHTRRLRESILRSPAYYSFGPSQAVEVFERVRTLASAYAWSVMREVGESRVPNALEPDKIAEEMWKRAGLLVRTARFEEARELYAYLMLPQGGVWWEELKEALERLRPVREGAPESWTFQVLGAPDPFTCHLLQVEHMLPVDTLEPYVQARERYAPSKELHVWEEEALVAPLESLTRRWTVCEEGKFVFSPHLVWFLAHHREETLLFGRCLLYSLIDVPVEWEGKPNNTGIVKEVDKSLLDALGSPFPSGRNVDFYEALDWFVRAMSNGTGKEGVVEALRKRRPRSKEVLSRQLDTLRERRITPFLDQSHPELQSIGLLMALVAYYEEYGEEEGSLLRGRRP